MFTVVSAEVVARKLTKDNEKIRKLVKIKNKKSSENLRLLNLMIDNVSIVSYHHIG